MNPIDGLCIITARGGSKRIPRKNIKAFCGKPIIAYSIEAALNSRLFDEVMVSTDDLEIAEIGQHYGATVPFMRSTKNSDDFATTADVLQEVVERYQKDGGIPQWICCLYPTAPFVTPEKLCAARELMLDGADSVMAITSFSYPPQRGMREQDGKLQPWFPECERMRSQDLPTIYHDCGQFYFLETSVLDGGSVVGDSFKGYVPELEVQDIDNLSDWKIAEMKYTLMRKNANEQA